MIDQVISHYRIIEKLGAGGMGEVYLAQDMTLGRRVALKILPHEYTADAERLRRFKLEARAASGLNHPNILTIHEVGEADGHHFITTEFIDGESLRLTLDRTGGMGTGEALRVAAQVASALTAAHEAGIVHRDIKPENIMLRRDGYAKVLDFGLAKLTEPAVASGTDSNASATGLSAHTRSGIVVGTTRYMSPEQATGGKVDTRSDIFSFGALLYEMLTGEAAFRGSSTMATVAAILTQEPAPLSAGVPGELATIIERCLRKDPERRYQTMADVKVALNDVMGEAIPSRQRRPLALRARWMLGAVPLLLAAGLFAWRSRREPQSPEPLRAVPLTTLPGVARYPSFSPDGDRVVFTWTGTNQDNPDVYVQQVGSGSPLRLTTDSANDFNPVWSPDGRWIAFQRSRGDGTSELRLIAPLGGSERKLTEVRVRGRLGVTPPYVAWCPDSSCLVVTDSPAETAPDALFLISLETGEKRQLTRPQPPALGDTHPAISPDGTWLVFRRMAGLFAGELYRLRLEKEMTAIGEPQPVTPGTLDAQHPTWMPDSKEILFAARGSLWRMDVTGVGTPSRLPFVGEYGLMPAVSRPQPGRPSRLVYVRSFEDFNLWRVETATPGRPASTRPAAAISSTRLDDMPQFSPDGRRVAFTSDRSGNWEIWLSNPDGTEANQLTSMAAVAAGYPHWSPGGDQVAFHSNVDGQWDIYVVSATGGKPRNLTAHGSADSFPSFSRDGQWIYFSSSRGGGNSQTVWKIPVAGGDAVQVTKTPGYAPQQSPDGAYVYYVDAVEASALWRLPSSGGSAVKVLDKVILANFAVTSSGIYYIDRLSSERGIHYVDFPSGETRLRYFDFTTQKSTTVANNLGTVDLPLTVSPDGRTILYSRMDSAVNDLMVVANFR